MSSRKHLFSLRKSANSFLEPEEIFMDSFNLHGFSSGELEGKIEHPISRIPFVVFEILLFATAIIFSGKIYYLQVSSGKYYQKLAENNKFYSVPLPAPRGIIYDRNLVKLVENNSYFSLVFRPNAFLGGVGDLERATDNVARLLKKSKEDFFAAGLPRDFDPQKITAPVVVAEELSREEILELHSRAQNLPGFVVEEGYARHYQDLSLSHTLGYVGQVSKDDLRHRAGYYLHDTIGKTGLEFIYEDVLRGTPGDKIREFNALNAAPLEKITRLSAEGQSLVLSLDEGLQKEAYRVMASTLGSYGERSGALVALDPRDGSVLSLISFPVFDNNKFSSPLTPEEFIKISRDKTQPFFNRVLSGEYPPGSTVKPFLAAAAIKENIIDPQQKIYDEGFISIPNPYKPGEVSTFLDWKKHGWINMLDAIAQSANVYFYTIGGGYGNIKGLGIERIKKYESLFGLGTTLGIDLPGERFGLLPDPAWKQSVIKNDPLWRVGDTYNTSIGQGYTKITPLQLASATSVLANRGTLWRPRVVQRVVDQERHTVKVFPSSAIRTNLLDEHSLDIARQGMRQAVTSGSARALADLTVEAAGKTGTAQTGVFHQSHAWFTGFAPYDSPEIVVTVLVENGGEGSSVAVPIAKEVLRYYFEQKATSRLP